MKNQSKQSRKKRSAQSETLGAGVGGTVVTIPRSLQMVTTRRISIWETLQTNAVGLFTFTRSGTFNALLTAEMQASASWPGIVSAYDEFQVESVHIRFAPCGPPMSVTSPYLLAYDVGNMPLGSPDAISAYATTKLMSGLYDGELEYKIPPTSTGIWYTTDSPFSWTASLAASVLIPPPPNTIFVGMLMSFTVRLRGSI